MPRVLYVDDEQANLDAVAPIVKNTAPRRGVVGLEVDTALGIAAANEKLASGSYDIIVTDYDLSKTDRFENGVNYAAALRERGVTTPIILYTTAWLEDIKQGHSDFDTLNIRHVQKNPEILAGAIISLLRPAVGQKMAGGM